MNIVMYHYIRPKDKNNGNLRYLSLDKFQFQLDYFEKNFGFLSKEEFEYNFKNKITNGKVLLTFDDGLKDHYNYVFPILKERNIKGIFFIPTSILISKKILNVHKVHYLLSNNNAKLIYERANELIHEMGINILTDTNEEAYKHSEHNKYELKLKKLFNYKIDFYESDKITDGLMDFFGLKHDYSSKLYLKKNNIEEMYLDGQIFGSHTNSHKILSSLNYENQKLEIENSFKYLSSFINEDFKTISYPYGYKFTYDTNTKEILKNSNVNFAFIFDNKKNNSFDKYEISRIDCNKF